MKHVKKYELYEAKSKKEGAAKKFKAKAEVLIDKIEDLIQTMPQKGNTSSECQRETLQQAINEFSYAVNGVKDSDFENEK